MATRSAIAIRNADKSYDVVYCHWDGYPSHQMPILTGKYGDARKARQLISKGDISCLETDKGWDQVERKSGPLYYFERGDTSVEPRNLYATGVIDFARDSWCEHIYTYVPRKGWQHQPVIN